MSVAKEGVEASLAQIPPPDFVTVLKTVPEDFDDGRFRKWGDRVCAFARRIVIIGSSRSMDEVVQAYTIRLESVQFKRTGRQYAHSATLYRGEREMELISNLTGGAWFTETDEEDFWRAKYATVAQVSLLTIVPGRYVCEQWSPDELREPYTVPTVTP